MMRRLELDANLILESGGRSICIESANGRLVARFSSLACLISVARRFWPYRKFLPQGVALDVAWRGLRAPVLRKDRNAA